MTDSKVISFHTGEPKAVQGRPVDHVVRFLRRVLKQAKAGQISSVAIAYVRTCNGWPSEGYSLHDGDWMSLSTAISCLHHRYHGDLNERDAIGDHDESLGDDDGRDDE